jgi:hypothetical protein
MDLSQTVAINFWLTLAFLVGRIAWAKSRSQVLAWVSGACFATIPYWHVPFAWWQYHAAASHDAGFHPGPGIALNSVYVVSDRPARDVFIRCMVSDFCQPLFDNKLDVAEIDDFSASGERRGVVRLSLADKGDPRCAELAEYNVEGVHDFWTLPVGRCFATEHVSEPTSRYEVTVTRTAPEPSRWLPLSSSAVYVRDRSNGKIVAWSRNYSSNVKPAWTALPGSVYLQSPYDRLSLGAVRRGRSDE